MHLHARRQIWFSSLFVSAVTGSPAATSLSAGARARRSRWCSAPDSDATLLAELPAADGHRAGLAGAFRCKRWRTGSTRYDRHAAPAVDLVDWDFTAAAPNRVWVADPTRIPCGGSAAMRRDAYTETGRRTGPDTARQSGVRRSAPWTAYPVDHLRRAPPTRAPALSQPEPGQQQHRVRGQRDRRTHLTQNR